MRIVRRATLLLALSLLTSAATAHAECAWVLWLQRDSSPWDVLQAFLTREGCIEALNKQVAAAEKRSPRVTLDTIGGSFTASAKGRTLHGQCLPDTIDPRGAKGK
jgi:hypothetical protein